MTGPLKIGNKIFRSRLIIGTGKYANFEVMKQADEASGAQLVTVAVRRINLENPSEETIIDHIDLVKKGRVRRAKLYYLRGLRGKAARIRERDTRGHRSDEAQASVAGKCK